MNKQIAYHYDGGEAFLEILDKYKSESPQIIEAMDMTRGFPSLSRSSTLALLWLLANYIEGDNPNIVEIGTCNGATAAMMAMANPRASILTMDIVDRNVTLAKELFKHPPSFAGWWQNYSRITAITADSTIYVDEYSKKAQMIFVDGDHGHAEKDLPWWNKLDVGGVMAFHDYHSDYPSVINACNLLKQHVGRDFDVWMPVDSGFVAIIRIPQDKDL